MPGCVKSVKVKVSLSVDKIVPYFQTSKSLVNKEPKKNRKKGMPRVTSTEITIVWRNEHCFYFLQMSFMKFSLVSLLILCVTFEQAMAGCRVVCRRTCSWGRCSYGCHLRCRWSGKRNHIPGRNENSKDVPFPSPFAKYDLDKDGGITLEELARALSVVEHAKATEKAFRRADRNGDGQIDCTEFKESPFLFAHRPKC